MITILERKHIRVDSTTGKEVIRAVISVATSSELPSKTGIDNTILDEGSRAWDISTGDEYGFTNDGQWHKQKERVRVDWLGGI